MKHIFITGIAGFIGFHLALSLKRRGDHVVGCDNFNPYYSPALKRQRADRLREEGILVFENDINSCGPIEQAIEQHGISHMVHLAAQAGVRYAVKHPETYVHSNLDGFVSLLQLLRRHVHIPLIYASSSSVYGLNSKIPFSESDQTDTPASFYGATKKCNEIIAHAYHHLYGIRCTGLRFFTAYGPWGRPDMAYYSFTRAIEEGQPINIFGTGEMRRDFTYIDDIVQGVMAAIDLGAPLEIFNLGNHHPHSVIELVETLESLLGKQAIKEFVPIPEGEVFATYADITKSQQQLRFNPRTSLHDGLEKFTTWYRTRHQVQDAAPC